jgi:hypothetical protein
MSLTKEVGLNGHTSRDAVKKAQSTGSAGAATTITLAAATNYAFTIQDIQWSYSAAPTGGKLTIANDGVTELEFDITAAGPGSLSLYFPGTVSKAVVVTLAAPGGAVVGKLNVQYTKESAATK